MPEAPLDLSHTLIEAGAKRSYVTAMTGRSGSTWLATALKQLPEGGNPVEYLSNEGIPYYGRFEGPQDVTQFFSLLVERWRTGGTFGLKIDPLRLRWISTMIDMPRTFGPNQAAWVDMRRWNIVKQAFSFARAKRSGRWHQFHGEAAAAPEAIPPIGDAAVWKEIFAICDSELYLEQFYQASGLQPLRIMYEELLDSKGQLLRRVHAHLFPKRSFPEQVALVDGTKRLNEEGENPEELDFVQRHAARINLVTACRGQKTGAEIAKMAEIPA